jgi:CYTH domain-containing protein
MGMEIERKFRVRSDAWRVGATGETYRQGYLSSVQERTVRVRVAGTRAMLTIKGPTRGISRLEFEYPIPLDDANMLLDELCEGPLIDKVRYRIPYGGLIWEVDEFGGDNAGLVIAEVELAHEQQAIELPPWIGAEVSGDSRYFNSSLARHPYSQWAR